jgi:hypothetical protein
MPCEQWYKLLERYRRTVKMYGMAVGRSGPEELRRGASYFVGP